MVVLCFCLGALGALAAYLVTSFDEERQDMDLVVHLRWIRGLGVISSAVIAILASSCCFLNVCLLDRHGCSGGGTFFRLGLVGVCTAPLLFACSVPIYAFFSCVVMRKLNNAEFTVERMKSPLWFDVCWGMMIGSWMLHLLVLALCSRIVTLLTCCHHQGEGFDNYHEFDNPSVFSMMDHYYYTELAGNGHTIYDQQGAEKRFHGSSVSAHSHITGHSMASQVSYQLYDGAASMASSKSPSMAHIPSPFRVTRRLSSSSSPKRKLEPHEALDGVQPLDLSMENPVGEVSVNLDAKK